MKKDSDIALAAFVFLVLTFAFGLRVGWMLNRDLDPLHQDSPAMHQWLELNTKQDFTGMYKISSSWLQKQMTEQEFIDAYGYKKTRTGPPPEIHFVASVTMPVDKVHENFYLVEEPGDSNLDDAVMVKTLVDSDGKFMGYPY